MRTSCPKGSNLIPVAFFVWMLLAFAILWIGNFTNLDMVLADHYYNFTTGKFPWKRDWFVAVLMHYWLRTILIVFGLGFILWEIAEWLRPKSSPVTRYRLAVVAISAALVPSTIAVLKRFSSSHCPWDIDRYGGDYPYIRLLEEWPAGMEAGQCMPAGHASSALWLAALAVFWLPRNPAVAFAVYTGGLLLGFGLGWAQQMRGAHFLTHTLWSVWIASVIIGIMIFAFRRKIVEADAGIHSFRGVLASGISARGNNATD